MIADQPEPSWRRAAFWAAPALLCLALYWRGISAWFRADDFAWLGTGIYIQNFHDFLVAIFAPQAQGTIRPLSERAFFMLGFSLFGLDALPFKLVVFATQFANLALIQSIGRRLTGMKWAGFWAAILWTLNSSGIEPMGWTCVYNQVLCGFFLLLAFRWLLRWIETGARRYYWLQWTAFLVGFGALELNVVYPALALFYVLCCCNRRRERSLAIAPMLAVSAAYAVMHSIVAPAWKTGGYAMHFTGAMAKTLAKYWTWTIGPTFLFTPNHTPKWILLAGIVLVTAALAAFALWQLRAGRRAVLFCLAWYAIVIAPVLPLRDHMTEYYLFLPAIGIAWLGGWALATAWRTGTGLRAAAIAIAVLYAAMGVPTLLATSQWNYAITMRVRTLVEGIAGIHERHPAQSILLVGVDTDLFWNAVLDRPGRLFGLEHLYLAPGSERTIDAHPDLGRIEDYILPAGIVEQALKKEDLVVYDVRGERLRNITSTYAAQAPTGGLPTRLDAASPLAGYLLGPEWYPSDGDHRWMPKRATLRLAAPTSRSMKLYLIGQCPAGQLQPGALPVTVTVNGQPLGTAQIQPSKPAFELAFPLPDSLVGASELIIAVEVARTFRPPADPRDLGLVFGTFEIR